MGHLQRQLRVNWVRISVQTVNQIELVFHKFLCCYVFTSSLLLVIVKNVILVSKYLCNVMSWYKLVNFSAWREKVVFNRLRQNLFPSL